MPRSSARPAHSTAFDAFWVPEASGQIARTFSAVAHVIAAGDQALRAPKPAQTQTAAIEALPEDPPGYPASGRDTFAQYFKYMPY